MKKNIVTLTLLAVSALGTSALYAGLIDFKLQAQVQSCVNVQGGCKQAGGINVIGDVVTIDITKHRDKIKDLGTIETKREEVKLAMPQQKDDLTIYSFKAKDAEIKKTIYVAFRNESEGPGKRESGKAIIYMYRQIEGDPQDKWVEAGEIKTDKGVPAPQEWPFNLEPDGTWVTINPKMNIFQKYHFGKQKITVTEEKAQA